MRLLNLIAAALLFAAPGSHAQDGKSIVVSQAFARATVGTQPNGAAFLTIENRSKSDDALVGASSPAAAVVEIHTMQMEGDVMKMRALEQLPLKAGQTAQMKPGQGAHLMLIDLAQPLKVGQKFPVTLEFRKAGKLPVTVEVTATGTAGKHNGKDGGAQAHRHD